MKIIITPENEEEEKQIGKSIVFDNVFEFGLIGRHIIGKIYEKTFSHLHIADRYILIGKLHEMLSRLDNDHTDTK